MQIIVEFIGPNLERQTSRNHALTPLEMLLITLRYYATGCFQQVTGDLFGVDKSTICRVIPEVSKAICSLKPAFIKMPANQQEIRKVSYDFYDIAGFPCVLGAIDFYTHVKIE